MRYYYEYEKPDGQDSVVTDWGQTKEGALLEWFYIKKRLKRRDDSPGSRTGKAYIDVPDDMLSDFLADPVFNDLFTPVNEDGPKGKPFHDYLNSVDDVISKEKESQHFGEVATDSEKKAIADEVTATKAIKDLASAKVTRDLLKQILDNMAK